MAKSILVVDDSSTMRQQLRMFLLRSGFHVIEASNGAEGIEQARAMPVDLVICDVNMPVMNGIEMLKAIRQLPNHQKTPVFVLTTESVGSMVQEGKAAGATAWIVKPFKPEILLKGIQKVLGIAP